MRTSSSTLCFERRQRSDFTMMGMFPMLTHSRLSRPSSLSMMSRKRGAEYVRFRIRASLG